MNEELLDCNSKVMELTVHSPNRGNTLCSKPPSAKWPRRVTERAEHEQESAVHHRHPAEVIKMAPVIRALRAAPEIEVSVLRRANTARCWFRSLTGSNSP
jgi:hypothetical protein